MLNKYRVLKKYRTCERCKAMFRGWCGHMDSCYLGYKLEQRKSPNGFYIGYLGELCPKPTTYKELLDSPAKWETTPQLLPSKTNNQNERTKQ